jgi:hypothetical protein
VAEIKKPFLNIATRSVARKVADHFDDIEEAIELGIPLTEIIEALGQKGVVVTFINFKSILRRLRAKKRKGTTPKQMKAITTHSQDGNAITNPNTPAVKTAPHISGTSTKSNPTENKVGSDLVAETKEAKIPFTWRELRKEVIDF